MINPRRTAHKAAPVKAREKNLPLLVKLQWRKLVRLMVAYPGDMVLDADCMEGTLLKQLERIHPRVQLCGACFTPAQARHARQLVRRADIMFADESDLPWMSESMDIAFIGRGFHALENPIATLREVERVLRSGGQILLCALWAPLPIRTLFNGVVFSEKSRARIRSKTEMTALLHTAGFEQIHFTHVGVLGCVVTALKK